MNSKTIQKLIDLINGTDADGKEELIKSLKNLDKKNKASVKEASDALKQYRKELNANQTALKEAMKAQ